MYGRWKRGVVSGATGGLVIVAMLVAAAGAWASTGSWRARVQVDRAAPSRAAAPSFACPSDTQCLAISDTTFGPATYTFSGTTVSGVDQFALTTPFGSGDNSADLLDIQCPSTRLCVGIADYASDEGDDVDVVTSTSPTAGPTSWLPEGVDVTGDLPAQLSCPSTSLCVGAGANGGIVMSQDPTGGANAWTERSMPTPIVEVDCPDSGFCVAVDTNGNVWTSTDPASTSTAWIQQSQGAPLKATATLAAEAQPNGIGTQSALSCSSSHLCIAAGDGANVLVGTDLAGSDASWTTVPVTAGAVNAVDCPVGKSLCLAGDGRGDIATSTDPATMGSWTSVSTQNGRFNQITCSAHDCMATGTVPLRAVIPTGGGSWQWQRATVPLFDPLNSVSCPTAASCLTTGTKEYFASANAARGVGSWRLRVADNEYRDHDAGTLDSACASATLCFAVTDDIAGGGLADLAGGDLYQFNPSGGSHDFTATGLGGGDDILFVTCAQGTCTAGYPGHWYQTTDPTSRTAWKLTVKPRFDITCLHANSSCVALAGGPFPGVAGPDLLVAAHRSGPWRVEDVDPGEQITGLACLRVGGCVVVDQSGRLLSSHAPLSGATSWHLSQTDPYGFSGVACQGSIRCVAVDTNGGVVVGHP